MVPLPPPWAGVEQVSRVLTDSTLSDRFDLRLLRANVRTSNTAKGRWDLAGVSRVGLIALRLAAQLLFRRPAVVYLPLSQNHAGLARDVLYLSICRVFCVPVVAHFHGSKLHTYLAQRPPWLRVILIGVLRGIRRIVVCGESLSVDLRPLFGDRVVAISNATPAEAFLQSLSKRSGSTVAFMAHLSRAKGFYDLVDAAGRVLERRPSATFLFAGEQLEVERNFVGAGAEPSQQRFQEIERRFPGRLKQVGVVTGVEKTDFLASADVFALPSHAEAFPISILEAMATGLPVIATPVGAVPEVVRPGVNGVLVSPGDPVALADAILKLLDNDHQRELLGRGAVETAREFSVKRQTDALAAVLTEAAGF